MAPAKKYKTDEERLAARRRSWREYYERNIEKERHSALRRWRTRQDAAPAARVRARAELPLLPQTVGLLGPELTVTSHVDLGQLSDALTSDLRQWYNGRRTKEAFEYCTRRLIAQDERTVLTVQLRNILTRKLRLSTTVEVVALMGENEARGRSPHNVDSDEYLDERLVLENLASTAANLTISIDELYLLWDSGAGALTTAYDEGALSWQSL